MFYYSDINILLLCCVFSLLIRKNRYNILKYFHFFELNYKKKIHKELSRIKAKAVTKGRVGEAFIEVTFPL